jgi:signal transduction histidine kinase/ligand-binding sensor domain-containing protein/DNA-binding response OmpR family regulator
MCFSVQAQVPAGRTMHYTQKDGLSFNIINSISQDKNGFIWFATGNGLNRFDGVNFRTFKADPENPSGIPGNYIQYIYTDSFGHTWVSSRKGLYSFAINTEKFSKHQIVKGTDKVDVTSISQNAAGNLWIATTGNGFSFLDQKTGRYVNYSPKTLKGLASNSILSVVEDPFGMLWVGTRDAGLCVFKLNQSKVPTVIGGKSDILPAARVNEIYRDHADNMWIATSSGLWYYQRKMARFHSLSASEYNLRSNVFLSLVEDRQHRLFIGLQEGGLYHLNLDKLAAESPRDFVFEQVEDENKFNITPRSVQDLFLDKDQNLWLGTYGDGSYMLSSSPAKFKHFSKKLSDKSGESYLRYYGMCRDAAGNLWLGTDGDGIYNTKPDGTLIKHYRANTGGNSLTDNAIISAYRDSQNRLWFGTYAKGLLLYDPGTDGFVSFKHDPKNSSSIAGNDIRVIREDRRKNIWIGTNGGGLSRLDPRTRQFRNYNTVNSNISSNDVRSIENDDRGNLWLGTYGGGLSYLVSRQDKIYPFTQNESSGLNLSGSIIYALHMDKQKRLWIGSESSGLLVYQTEKKSLLRFSEKNGLADNSVYAILEESPGKVWISTNEGLSSIDLTNHKLYNFNGSDGLQGGQFNAGSALVDDKAGTMYFGGTEGWNMFYPKAIKPSSYKPQVRITGLQLYGKEEKDKGNIKPISESGHITLESGQSVFSIQYIALNFAYPKDAQFAYQLEGLEKDWNYVKYQRSATYRYLQPGTYTFKVKATNQDNIWQEDYATLTISILPPWYKSWWAYVLYTVMGVLAVYGFTRYKATQAKLKYRIRIADMEAQQERELHESKLSFFTNISHEFRSPLTLIINPVREMIDDQEKSADTANLNIVYRNAKRLLSLVDQLLLFSKAETKSDRLNISQLDLVALCEEVFLCFSHQAAKKNISYSFKQQATAIESPGIDCNEAATQAEEEQGSRLSEVHKVLIYGDREKIEIALFNLISNALRHTPQGGAVKLSILEDQRWVTVEVEDTGTGIAPEIGNRVFDRFFKVRDGKNYKGGFGIGLYLVKNFVDQHQGHVSFSSKMGEGTTFTIKMLKGNAHFSQHLIMEGQQESSAILEELNVFDEDIKEHELALTSVTEYKAQQMGVQQGVSSDIQTLLIIDDNEEIRHYISKIFSAKFEILEAGDGEQGLQMINRYLPDMIISDVLMQNLNGIELCSLVKADPALNHIPLILLTASASSEIRLKGIECGADDYISKPFEKELLMARVEGLLKSRNNLQTYFYNKITLKSGNLKISAEYKDFLDRCIEIVEKHITDGNFGISTLAEEIGMSRSNLYTKIKSISGQSANGFIRYIRLRKAAEIFINTDLTVQETILRVGIRDARYFREQFFKLFQMNPSDYIRKYRKTFSSRYAVSKTLRGLKDEI